MGVATNKKKNSSITLIIYLCAAIIALCAGIMMGYAIDTTMTEDNDIDILAAISAVEKIKPKDAFLSAIKDSKSNARKGGLAGLIIVGVYYAYTSTTKKRYHRKGVEHGSARWGTDDEKKVLQDSKDLYNNIIYADDIYLVLDRNERERNK